MAYWTLAAHPGSFRVEDNVHEQDEELWRTNGRKVARGDQVAIYKYKGREEHRGVVALGEVLTDPEVMYIPQGTDPYELNSGHRRELQERTEWVRVRYVRPPRLPLWADLGTGSVMDELAVTRAQGGTAHRVTPEQWERLLAEAGQEPWASGQASGHPSRSTPRGRSVRVARPSSRQLSAQSLPLTGSWPRGAVCYRV